MIGSRSRYCVVMRIVGRRNVVHRNSCVSSVTAKKGERGRGRKTWWLAAGTRVRFQSLKGREEKGEHAGKYFYWRLRKREMPVDASTNKMAGE